MVGCGVRLRLIVPAVALALIPARAVHAGLSRFGWLLDTDVVPERAVELQQWTAEEGQQGATNHDETTLAWAPVVGITDRVEVALPVEWTWQAADGVSSRTAFSRFGAELRWRLVTNDPVEAPAFAPLVRVAVNRIVTERDALEVAADLVGSYHCGRIHVVGNAGIVDALRTGADGPNLAWNHGRFWVAVALPIGLYQIRVAPRLTWAIAF
jgi:hypothetical protein